MYLNDVRHGPDRSLDLLLCLAALKQLDLQVMKSAAEAVQSFAQPKPMLA